MKQKLIVLSLLSVLMLSSCNKELDNATVTNDENLISFSTYSNLSKGIISDNNNFPSDGSKFRVAAFLNSFGKYMDCEIVANAQKVWNYVNSSDQAYWPSSPLTFVAFTPVNAGTITFGETASTVNYTAPVVITNQVDLMYAFEENKSKPANGASVQLNFKHALTQINFNATTTSSNLFVDIDANGIELFNLINSGTLTVSTSAPNWALGSNKSTYKISNTAINGISNSGSTPVTNTSEVLMLIPQSVTAWDVATDKNATTNTNTYLKINCKIYSKATSDSGDRNVYLHGSESAYDYIYVPFSGDNMHLIGKRITYTMQFGGGYSETGDPILAPITFSSIVGEWLPA